jgi:hypothetical protein
VVVAVEEGALPSTHSKREIDAFVRAGERPMYRTVNAGIKASDNKPFTAKQAKQGLIDGSDAFTGTGVHGNGIYAAAPGRTGTEAHARQHTQLAYGRTGTTETIRMTLKADANTVDNTALSRQTTNRRTAIQLEQNNPSTTPQRQRELSAEFALLGDPGRAAAAFGYDAIRVPGGNNGAGFSRHDYWVIVNRSALRVEV